MSSGVLSDSTRVAQQNPAFSDGSVQSVTKVTPDANSPAMPAGAVTALGTMTLTTSGVVQYMPGTGECPLPSQPAKVVCCLFEAVVVDAGCECPPEQFWVCFTLQPGQDPCPEYETESVDVDINCPWRVATVAVSDIVTQLGGAWINATNIEIKDAVGSLVGSASPAQGNFIVNDQGVANNSFQYVPDTSEYGSTVGFVARVCLMDEDGDTECELLVQGTIAVNQPCPSLDLQDVVIP